MSIPNTDISDEAVTAGASRIDDLLTMLGVDPNERPEHGGPTIADTLTRAALAAALPIVLASRDEPAGEGVDAKLADVWPDPFGHWTAEEAEAARAMKRALLSHLPLPASRDSETAELRAEIEALKAKLNEAYQHIGEQALIDMEEPIPPYGSPERDARVQALRGGQGE